MLLWVHYLVPPRDHLPLLNTSITLTATTPCRGVQLALLTSKRRTVASAAFYGSEVSLHALRSESWSAADLRTLLLGQCTPLEQDKYLEAIRAAGFATRESVLQAALPGQSTRVSTDEAPTLQAAELAASIFDFIDGQCDWPEFLGVDENACGKEIKRAFYNALCCLRKDEYRESDAVMFGLRTMQDTIKSQRSDVFPKEKYVSSNPAERQYDKEFVKLNKGNQQRCRRADTESINASDGDDDDLASIESMDASDDEEEDGVNDDEDSCGMDFMSFAEVLGDTRSNFQRLQSEVSSVERVALCMAKVMTKAREMPDGFRRLW
ncbi:hypothetical protein KC330_g94 [Hortaea werneckii]|nr:hypothetical protein KC330_g94 [Hortaea werneckii]